MDEKRFDQALEALYSAASGKQAWGAAMNQTAAVFGAWAVQLIGINKIDGSVLFSHDGGRASPEAGLDYIREYHRNNPRVPSILALGKDEWFHDQDHFDDEFVAREPFFRDFLTPYGGGRLSATKIIDTDEQLIVFAALRGYGEPPFDQKEIAHLTRVKQHLASAIGIQSHLRTAHSQLQAGTALLNQFDRPMILIDAERTIRFSNAAGNRTLESGDYVSRRHGVLHCRDMESDRALSVALYQLHLLDGLHHKHAPPNRRFIRTRAASDGAPIGIYLVALRPEATMGTFGPEARALVFFHDFRSSPGLDPMIVAETFNLTPAEARVAVALASGHALEDIASRHGVSIVTVRTQLRAVFAKTGTARQADLVRLLATMPSLSLDVQ